MEIDNAKLAALHESFLKVQYDQRDDVTEMRKYVPEWEPKRPRW